MLRNELAIRLAIRLAIKYDNTRFQRANWDIKMDISCSLAPVVNVEHVEISASDGGEGIL